MKKTIVLLHFTASPIVGGVESVLSYHARLMAAAGNRVRVVAGRGDRFDEAIQFIHLPLADSLHPSILAAKSLLDHGEIPANFDELVKALYESLAEATAGADLIIAHNVGSLHKNLALTAALRQLCAGRAAPRLVLWHHDLAWATVRYQSELHPGWPWDLLRQDWPDVEPKHVVVSELRRRELADLLHRPEETIAVVPSGLDVATFLKLEPITITLYHRLHLDQANPILLLPVRITRRKNIELAIEVIAVLQKTFPHIKLIVTGPLGPHNPANRVYFAELTNLRAALNLDSAVHFLAEVIDHYLLDPVIADFYRLADALLFPSHEEGFGIPILEAGLVSLPIFCADIPPFRETAGDFATYFSPTAAADLVAQQITGRLQNAPLYQLRNHIRQHYRWESIYHHQIEPLLAR